MIPSRDNLAKGTRMDVQARVQTTGYIRCNPDFVVYDDPHVFADIRLGTGHYVSSEQPAYFDELAKVAQQAADAMRAKTAALTAAP